MNKTSPHSYFNSIDAVYVQLSQHDIEEFNTGYQCWNLLQQKTALQTQIGELHRQIAENTQRMQEIQPTAIALATLARLQSNGVSDIELLDRMLEQGEVWLDRTIQRLEYFEQLDDFISDDYAQWCLLALEGAYDWIDSMLDGSPLSSSPVATSRVEKLSEATEELFLQKLSSEEYEEEASMLETTLKRPAITLAHPPELALSSKDTPIVHEEPLSTEYIEDSADCAEPFSNTLSTLQGSKECEASEIHPTAIKEMETHSNKKVPAALVRRQQNKPHKWPNPIMRIIVKIWGYGKS